MPETAAQPAATASAVRRRAAREAARRREALAVLQIGEACCRYGASILGNGADPREAREAAVECASELAMIAETLRRLSRLSSSERRQRAVLLVGLGWSKHRVAVQLGVSDRAVRNYVSRSRPGRDSTT